MCTVCGCGGAGYPPTENAQVHLHRHDHDHDHHHHPHDYHDDSHPHGHRYRHRHDHLHDHPHVPDYDHLTHPEPQLMNAALAIEAHHTHAPGVDPARMVRIEQDILAENNRYAEANRALFAERGILALNLVSSPGSGKTTLLVKTIEALKNRYPIAVIEGDQQTAFDAERIRATGVAAVQINTGKGCHLDAHQVGHALEKLPLPPRTLLFIENVGNLVCPAGFDLGEAAKVVLLSVTEGEDKPLKYPDIFAASALMVVTKSDLLAHVDFDLIKATEYARRVQPQIETIVLSARSGEGFNQWLAWIETHVSRFAKSRVA